MELSKRHKKAIEWAKALVLLDSEHVKSTSNVRDAMAFLTDTKEAVHWATDFACDVCTVNKETGAEEATPFAFDYLYNIDTIDEDGYDTDGESQYGLALEEEYGNKGIIVAAYLLRYTYCSDVCPIYIEHKLQSAKYGVSLFDETTN